MDIRTLETFALIAELKSFTQAAQKLGFSQSAVSFQIRQLENELGTPLFERINHTVTLTNAGRSFLPLAHQMLNLSSEALHLLQDEALPSGTVHIAAAESLSSWQFSHVFWRFHEQFPNIHLKVISSSTDEMFRMLSQNQVDLVYTLENKVLNHHYKVAFEAPVQVSFVAATEHPLAKVEKLTLEDILFYPLLLTEKAMSYRTLLDNALAARGEEAKPVLELGDTHLLVQLLRQGKGISFLPDFAVQDDIDRGILTRLCVPELEGCIWRQLLYHRNKWLSPELRCVIDFLKEN